MVIQVVTELQGHAANMQPPVALGGTLQIVWGRSTVAWLERSGIQDASNKWSPDFIGATPLPSNSATESSKGSWCAERTMDFGPKTHNSQLVTAARFPRVVQLQ